MKWLRKVCSAGLSLVLALSMIPAYGVQALAENTEPETLPVCEVYDSLDGSYQSGDISSEAVSASLPSYLASGKIALNAEEALYNGLLEHKSSINILVYGVSESDFKAFFQNVINNHADLFFVGNEFSYYTVGNLVSSVIPNYSMDKEEADAALEYFYDETEQILSQVNENWSDVEKALFLQDYLCVNYEYDTNLSTFDSYHFLKDKKGVCQAYSITYNYLIQQEGIEGTFATSDSMCHMWNIIKINGNWYHVDVTWDDPTNDMLGRARHYYFLKSDAQMSARKHYDWTSDVKCTATDYDTAFWDDMDAPFVYQNGEWYCIDTTAKTISSCSINEGKKLKNIYAISDKWYVLGGSGKSYWTDIYSGLGGYDGKLYFNTPNKICAYNLTTNKVETVYTLSDASTKNLYGIYMNQNIVYYGLAKSPNEQVTLSGTVSVAAHTHSYGEGVVTTQPTCQKTGVMTYTCASCGAKKTEEIPMIDHNYVNGSCTMCKQNCETIFSDDCLEPDEESGVLYGVSANVTVQEMEESSNYAIRVLDADDKEVTDENALVGTGDTIQILNNKNKVIAEYQVCIKGDTSGDGLVNVSDLEQIQISVLQIKILDGVYYEAGLMVEKETKLSVLDMEIVQKHILGIDKLY